VPIESVFLEQPDPSREGRDYQSRSEKGKQTGEFCIETEHAPRGDDPEKEIAGRRRVNPRGKAVLIPEKIHLPDRGSVLGVFQDEAQKNNGAKIHDDDSHCPEPQNPEIVRVVVKEPSGREGRQHITRGSGVDHQGELAHVFQGVHFMQSLGGRTGLHEATIWQAFRFVPVHR